MSAFGGNVMQFGLRIGATDDTRTGLRSALGSVQGFVRSVIRPIQIPLTIARGGLGLLRDINLGLAPLVRGLDHIIERGSAVEVQQKAFRALTGANARDADRLAQSIVKAASGTVTMARGMQVANRALASGMTIDQLRTATEFISKFSVAIGQDAGEALNKVITGLARGSTLFLDDFGILVDGVEKVRADFDAIQGSGAFDQLGPAAQKAETVRKAIEEMAQRTSSLGVSGRETIFIWQSLKNTISDSVDGIMATIARSGALKDALKGLRDILSGVNEHFNRGGSIGEIFFGKGQSGGLLGIAKGALVDAGSAIGRGILGTLAIGIGSMPEMAAWLTDALGGAIQQIGDTLRGVLDEFIDKIENRLFPKIGGMRQFEGTGETSFWARLVASAGLFTTGDPRTGRQSPGLVDEPRWWAINRAVDVLIGLGLVGKPAQATPKRPPTPGNWGMPLFSPAAEPQPKGIFTRLTEWGRSILGGGVFGGDSATQRASAAFGREFPGIWNDPSASQTPPVDPGKYRLRAATRRTLLGEIRVREAKLRNILRGGNRIRQDALKASGATVRSLLREGYDLSPRERREIFNEELSRRINAARGPVDEEIAERQDRLLRDDVRSGRVRPGASPQPLRMEFVIAKAVAAAAQGGGGFAEEIRGLRTDLGRFVGAVAGVMRKLTGVEMELANARGRNT